MSRARRSRTRSWSVTRPASHGGPRKQKPRSRPDGVGEGVSGEGGAETRGDAPEDIGRGEEAGPVLAEPQRLVGEGRVRGQGPAQPGAEQQPLVGGGRAGGGGARDQ